MESLRAGYEISDPSHSARSAGSADSTTALPVAGLQNLNRCACRKYRSHGDAFAEYKYTNDPPPPDAPAPASAPGSADTPIHL
jgi:hypothetical protein